MMKKKLMAVAVGAALAAPALSYATVEISGRANAGIGTWSATGATLSTGDYASRTRVWDSGSNITIKANEDLGGGLTAETYLETGINVDSGSNVSQGGDANSATGFFGSRQAWVGLGGNFGKVTIGKQNTFYGSGDQDLTQAVYLDAGVQFATGVLKVSPGVNRLTNSIRYTSPKLGPVEVLVTYATPGETGLNSSSTPSTSAKVTAVTVQGAQGAVSGGFDWTENDNGLGTKASGMKLRGGFKYQPGAQISLIYITDTTKTATGDAKQSAWEINWEHQMGNIGLHAQYGVAGDYTNTSGVKVADSSTKAMELGVRFIMSKTTYTYINYVAYQNDKNTNLDFNAGGMSSAGAGGITAVGAATLGADPKSLAIGISHRF